MRFPEDVPTLTDGVVTLRAHRSDDLEGIVEQCSDPESVARTTVPAPYGPEHAAEWVGASVPAGWRQGSDLHVAIEVDGRFAGSAGLRPDRQGSAEIAYGLHPGARGRGVASRAVRLLLGWGFHRQGYGAVTWRAQAGNWASRRVAWATGFHFGPTVPLMLLQRGSRHDAWTGWVAAGDSGEPTCRWLDVPVLESGPLRLRPWRDDDADRIVEASNDPRLRRFMPRSALPYEHAHARAYLQRVHSLAAEGTRISWCVADREDDAVLGNVALFDLAADDSAQVGYWAHPKARADGVISTAGRPPGGRLGARTGTGRLRPRRSQTASRTTPSTTGSPTTRRDASEATGHFGSHCCTFCGLSLTHLAAAASGDIPPCAMYSATTFWSWLVQWKFCTSLAAGLPDCMNSLLAILSRW